MFVISNLISLCLRSLLEFRQVFTLNPVAAESYSKPGVDVQRLLTRRLMISVLREHNYRCKTHEFKKFSKLVVERSDKSESKTTGLLR